MALSIHARDLFVTHSSLGNSTNRLASISRESLPVRLRATRAFRLPEETPRDSPDTKGSRFNFKRSESRLLAPLGAPVS